MKTYSADRVMIAVPSVSVGLLLTLCKAEEACADFVTPAVELQLETKAPLGPTERKMRRAVFAEFWLGRKVLDM